MYNRFRCSLLTACCLATIINVKAQQKLDTSTSLMDRIGATRPELLADFREAGMSPTQHQLTAAEREKVSAAFNALPPLHQRILKEHLINISFLDGMPNTALTAPIKGSDPHLLFDMTIRAATISQSASEWLTEKERSTWKNDSTGLSVSIDAGTMNAINYIVLHEATHVVDGTLRSLEKDTAGKPLPGPMTTAFTTGIWNDIRNFAPAWQHTLIDSSRFRTGRPQPYSNALGIYQALQKSPFVSLYGTASWHEDLAEYIAVYHLTQKEKQPFRITLIQNGKNIWTYEPMKNKRVLERGKAITVCYDTTLILPHLI